MACNSISKGFKGIIATLRMRHLLFGTVLLYGLIFYFVLSTLPTVPPAGRSSGALTPSQESPHISA